MSFFDAVTINFASDPPTVTFNNSCTFENYDGVWKIFLAPNSTYLIPEGTIMIDDQTGRSVNLYYEVGAWVDAVSEEELGRFESEGGNAT